MFAVEEVFEIPADLVHGGVLVEVVFFEDNAAFAFDFGGRESWVQEEVTEDVEGEFSFWSLDFDVIARVFFAGEGVEFAAYGVNGFSDAAGRRKFLAAFEEHVFKEVAEAALLRSFVAAASAGEDEAGEGGSAREVFGDDWEARIKHKLVFSFQLSAISLSYVVYRMK